MSEEHAVMGQYLRDYKPRASSFNWVVNDLFGAPPVRAFGPSAVIVQQKRIPDVSFYQGDIDWAKTRSQTDAVIIRAGQNTWEDPQFGRNWTEAKRLGMKRGLYWFYDDRVSPGAQASLLMSMIAADLPELEIYADWEKSYGGSFGGLGNVVAFMQAMEQRFPSVRTGLYTGYYFFRDHSNVVTNAAQYTYLKNRSLWEAWYTSNASYVLIPAPWTSLVYWQFGTPAIGAEYGVKSSEIDMSYFNGTQADFDLRYGGVIAPAVHTQPYSGVDRYVLTRNGVKVVVEVTDMHGRRARVVYHPWLKRVSQFATENAAQLGWNANAWDVHQANGPWVPQGVCVSDGGTVVNDRSGVPVLNIDRDGKVSILEGAVSGLYNAISGFRMIVRDARNVVPTNDPDLKYKELHARSGKGVTADGKLITVTTDGVYPGSGLTIRHLADVFVEFGAVRAFDNDSGGSSTDYDSTIGVLNAPADGHERAVICGLLVYAEGDVTMARYEGTAIADGTRLRPEHNTNNQYINQYPRGTRFHGDELWVALADVFGLVNGVQTLLNLKGDTWLKVTDIGGVPINGAAWVAITHKGLPICTLVDLQPTTPPAATKVHQVDVYADGSLVIDGKPYA